MRLGLRSCIKRRTHIPGFVRLATSTLILLKVRDLGCNASYRVGSLAQRFRIIVRARGRFPHLDIYFFVIQLLLMELQLQEENAEGASLVDSFSLNFVTQRQDDVIATSLRDQELAQLQLSLSQELPNERLWKDFYENAGSAQYVT